MEQLKAEIFPSCLLNKSLKVKKWWKKSNITFSKGPIFQFRYSLHQQHMILTKCTHFISRYFLDMMHDRLNCRLCLLLCSLSLTEGCCLINLENYLHFIELLYFLKKMREIDLAVINAYVKAWIKKYVWKSRQMREYWQVCNMFTSNSSNKFNSDFANTFTSASATCSPVPRETCSPVP